MAILALAGVQLTVPDDQVEAIKAKIVETRAPDGHTTLSSPPGEPHSWWVYIPYGAAVAITTGVDVPAE